MNTGLKNYTKQLNIKMASIGNAHVNLFKNDANLIFEIPLISSISSKKIEISLIYNHQLKNNLYELGYGCQTNLSMNISPYGSGVVVSDCYNVSDTVLNFDVYYRKLGYKVSKTIETVDSDSDVEVYTLIDKYDNKIEYKNENEIRYIDSKGEVIRVNDNEISNDYNERIIRTYTNNLLTKLSYYQYNTLITETRLTYNDNRLINISYYKGTELINNIEINYLLSTNNKNGIYLKNIGSNYKIYFEYENDYVTRVIEGKRIIINNNVVDVTNPSYTFTYNNYDTIVKDIYNNECQVVFNTNKLCLTERTNKTLLTNLYNEYQEIVYTSDLITPSVENSKSITTDLLSSYNKSGVCASSVHIT